MHVSEFSFELPDELIAPCPCKSRAECRLFVLDRNTQSFCHATFAELPQWIGSEDLLILNNSQVLPALLESQESRVSFLLVQKDATDPTVWIALASPAKKARPGTSFTFVGKTSLGLSPPVTRAWVVEAWPGGRRKLQFEKPLDLATFGNVPLPPYVRKRRKELSLPLHHPDDETGYQTVYASQPGSVAAPTAGLHFTWELLEKFRYAFVTLHVGPGTFLPIRSETIAEHRMEPEYFEIGEELRPLAQQSKRLVAVGTTVARVLESRPSLEPGPGWTDLFIYPPYSFRRVGALLTNFHLPRSSPLLLVSAFAGWDLLREAYKEAIRERYLFYSFGDAMLII
ncbi:tRNA preQ1(34) S-adenosylmethionine ribosyltransferase-isomerase QueA [Candidatus Methylacidithermus pantelleriae]|uniref:S-adenosylmethionine:tRNA ribosyltransferase-isomerase n=1 Tax=Candidatus Methylacidithermus pantelleriae TaxID=2744239 RepID=A0A8J2BMW5_9BACT|nr:tRNA preQ1(34) S-adenosylmethionine ribosyltransferase-isomerase QueA [Candidatus Methylacidithermus pantelleriae]CAF0691477.1 S-adenosylmethionine:tRNA ribosyltransferase-isomerase [Candidatus Methylacidithermus pantelleriae]